MIIVAAVLHFVPPLKFERHAEGASERPQTGSGTCLLFGVAPPHAAAAHPSLLDAHRLESPRRPHHSAQACPAPHLPPETVRTPPSNAALTAAALATCTPRRPHDPTLQPGVRRMARRTPPHASDLGPSGAAWEPLRRRVWPCWQAQGWQAQGWQAQAGTPRRVGLARSEADAGRLLLHTLRGHARPQPAMLAALWPHSPRRHAWLQPTCPCAHHGPYGPPGTRTTPRTAQRPRTTWRRPWASCAGLFPWLYLLNTYCGCTETMALLRSLGWCVAGAWTLTVPKSTGAKKAPPCNHPATALQPPCNHCTYGCNLRYIRSQPPLHTVAASATYGCSLRCIRLQGPRRIGRLFGKGQMARLSEARGCNPMQFRLQPCVV